MPPRYRRLYDLLKNGNIEIRVVSRAVAPFLHVKAGVVRRPDGTASAFMGSLNETREGWSENYELVWEDSSPDGVAWVEEEFEYLWAIGKPLPDAIVDEIGRSARRVEVQLEELAPTDIAPAALVESNLYRGGEQLMPCRSFVGLFLEHRDIYGQARILLADEVGVGKTLSLAGSALVSSLLGDGPVLILCPATLTGQWQMELKDKLNIPSAVWLSSIKAWQLDPDELPLPSVGAEGVLKCPRQIAIVSTGLIVHHTQERQLLMSKSFGMLIVDAAHRARGKKVLGQDDRDPNNLLTFLNEAAKRTKHVLLGTATPIQTDIADLWDLMKVLGKGASHVMGDGWSLWNDQAKAIPVITGQVKIQREREAWDWFRNPIPPAKESEIVFGHIRNAIGMRDNQFICELPFSQIPDDDNFVRPLFEDEVLGGEERSRLFSAQQPRRPPRSHSAGGKPSRTPAFFRGFLSTSIRCGTSPCPACSTGWASGPAMHSTRPMRPPKNLRTPSADARSPLACLRVWCSNGCAQATRAGYPRSASSSKGAASKTRICSSHSATIPRWSSTRSDVTCRLS